MRGELGTAALAASAVSTFRAHGLVRRELHPLFILGVASAYEGDVDAGRRALRRMLDLAVTAGDVYFEVMAYFGTVLVEVDFGDVDAAAEAGLQSLRRNQRIDARLVTAFLIDSLAWVADAQGDHLRAATLFGAAAAIWDSAGAKPDIAVSIPHRRHRKSTRTALGDTQFDAAHAAGRALPTDAAIRYALGETTTDAVALDATRYPRSANASRRSRTWSPTG
ncbi:hypothetical protein ACFQV2_24875 [Actinokineospora soli]|uniref:Uncharacterized protein n=1 Tax=Actinokineospora soli TaxID=1048753 RepID=A0ABW2TSA3_9PSEU